MKIQAQKISMSTSSYNPLEKRCRTLFRKILFEIIFGDRGSQNDSGGSHSHDFKSAADYEKRGTKMIAQYMKDHMNDIPPLHNDDGYPKIPKVMWDLFPVIQVFHEEEIDDVFGPMFFKEWRKCKKLGLLN